jgi:hypothetical protein
MLSKKAKGSIWVNFNPRFFRLEFLSFSMEKWIIKSKL